MYPARVHDVPVPGFPGPAGIAPPLQFDPSLATARPPLVEPPEPSALKIIASSRASLDRELEDAEAGRAGDLEPLGRRHVAGPEHARHGVEEDRRGQFDALEVAGRGQDAVDERCLETALPGGEEVEAKAVGRIHPGRAIAAEAPALACVFPPEDDVHRLFRTRAFSRAPGDLFRIGQRGAALETPAAGGERQEQERPEGAARRSTVHVAECGATTVGSVSSCRLTASGNRWGRPRASVHTRAVRARARVASSDARAIR